MIKPAAPPEIAEHTFIRHINSGGFADVFLYAQTFPKREVAIKVLRPLPEGAAATKQFEDEANVMAQLAGHPSIVPIYSAGRSDDGRSYIAMEFCPPPALVDRYRIERIPIEEVLDIGVRIASAIETAHRAGILHRDIKPHNILRSAYGTPKLTDFGIAGLTGAEGGGAGRLDLRPVDSVGVARGAARGGRRRSAQRRLLAGGNPLLAARAALSVRDPGWRQRRRHADQPHRAPVAGAAAPRRRGRLAQRPARAGDGEAGGGPTPQRARARAAAAGHPDAARLRAHPDRGPRRRAGAPTSTSRETAARASAR